MAEVGKVVNSCVSIKRGKQCPVGYDLDAIDTLAGTNLCCLPPTGTKQPGKGCSYTGGSAYTLPQDDGLIGTIAESAVGALDLLARRFGSVRLFLNNQMNAAAGTDSQAWVSNSR